MHSEFAISTKLVRTQGSFDALLALEAQDKGFAIVQADVLYHYIHGGHALFPVGQRSSRIRGIAKMCDEWLWIQGRVARDNDVNDGPSVDKNDPLLTSKDAYCGGVGSGSLVTAVNVAQILHTSWQDEVHHKSLQSGDGTDLLLKVKSPPGASGREKVEPGYEFLTMSPSQASALTNALKGTYGIHQRSEPDSLSDQSGGVVLTVPAILVGTSGLSAHEVKSAVNAVRRLSALSQETEAPGSCSVLSGDAEKLKFSDTDARPSTSQHQAYLKHFTTFYEGSGKPYARHEGLPVALDRHIRVWNGEGDWLSRLIARIFLRAPAEVFGLITGIMAALWYMRKSTLKLFVRTPESSRSRIIHPTHLDRLREVYTVRASARALGTARAHVAEFVKSALPERLRDALVRNSRILLIFLSFLFAHVAVGGLVWLAEFLNDGPEPESDIATGGIFNATWMIAQVAVANTSLELRSHWSLGWVAILKGGYAVAGLVTMATFGAKVSRWIHIQVMVNHIVIIGWNARGPSVVRELEAQAKLDGAECEVRVMIAADRKKYAQPPPENTLTEISLEAALEKSSYLKARACLVLADKMSCAAMGDRDADLWALKVVEGIQAYESKTISQRATASPPQIVVEALNPRNAKMVRNSRADEVLCFNSFGNELLAQAAIKPGVTQIYNEIMETSEDSCEFYFIDIPSDLVGSQFALAMQVQLRLEGVIIVGIRQDSENGELILNPPADSVLREGDRLVALAHRASRATP